MTAAVAPPITTTRRTHDSLQPVALHGSLHICKNPRLTYSRLRVRTVTRGTGLSFPPRQDRPAPPPYQARPGGLESDLGCGVRHTRIALHLTRGSKPGRQCRVIWQRDNEVGVEFLNEAVTSSLQK